MTLFESDLCQLTYDTPRKLLDNTLITDVRFGSLADINHYRQQCPLSGVKRTLERVLEPPNCGGRCSFTWHYEPTDVSSVTACPRGRGVLISTCSPA